jgi:UDP-3-O-[3-hydroxymyristoyl] glucosamine N-acyltransferase
VPKEKGYSLSYIADLTNTKIVGNKDFIVDNLSTLENASNTSITFLANTKYKKYLKNTKSLAIITNQENIQKDNKNYIVSENPYEVYAIVSKLFKSVNIELDNKYIHPSAIVSNDALIGKNVSIGANVVIGPNCSIGNNVIIKSNCSIVQDVQISENTIIHNGTVLGSDGFGYASTKNGYVKIEQIGRLIIGSDVEIGACCSIDRGAITDTEIHDGVKLDNQIQIGHNVIIGKNSAIAALCGIAGSTVIGQNFRMGGMSGVVGHIKICDDVAVGAHTLITKDIKEPGNYIGTMPTQDKESWAKSSIFIKKRG